MQAHIKLGAQSQRTESICVHYVSPFGTKARAPSEHEIQGIEMRNATKSNKRDIPETATTASLIFFSGRLHHHKISISCHVRHRRVRSGSGWKLGTGRGAKVMMETIPGVRLFARSEGLPEGVGNTNDPLLHTWPLQRNELNIHRWNEENVKLTR